MEQLTWHIRITGKVQGVYYRQSTVEKARQVGVKGFVRNRSDGSVEIFATGTEEQLSELARWCETGPPDAHVKQVIKTERSYMPFTDFTIER